MKLSESAQDPLIKFWGRLATMFCAQDEGIHWLAHVRMDWLSLEFSLNHTHFFYGHSTILGQMQGIKSWKQALGPFPPGDDCALFAGLAEQSFCEIEA